MDLRTRREAFGPPPAPCSPWPAPNLRKSKALANDRAPNSTRFVLPGYTQKQWGVGIRASARRDPENACPVRFTADDSLVPATGSRVIL